MIVENLRTVIGFDKELKDLEAKMKEIQKEKAKLLRDTTELMDQENVEKITVDDVGFNRDLIISFSLDTGEAKPSWDGPVFFDWLKENNLGDIIKTKESVHYGTRESTLKEWMNNGNSLPPFIKDSYFDTIKYKGGFKKAK